MKGPELEKSQTQPNMYEFLGWKLPRNKLLCVTELELMRHFSFKVT